MGTLLHVACTAVLAGAVLTVPGPAYADELLCGDLDADVVQQTDSVNQPFVDMLHVREAQSEGIGAGVTVAVVDAGVASNRWLPEVTSKPVAGNAETHDLPTLVAGLIGGRKGEGRSEPLGIAPGVRIVSVKVYDGVEAGDTGQPVTPDNVARGIDAAVNAGADVIDVSTATQDSDALRRAVQRALGRGVVVVAAIGERPPENQPGFEQYGTPKPDENVQTYPAAYRGVLGVSIGTSDGGDPTATIPASDAIDVVAPVLRTVSTTRNGSTCVLDFGSTALAAGEVSGLAALLVAKYEHYDPAQITALIMETATGTTDDRSLVDGVGMIQPNEAMTRQLRIDRDGTVVQAHQQVDRTPPVAPPDPGDDPFLGMRRSLVWWAVLAGGGLLLALLVRPLLRR
jgi:membrane-anchored mycosin MYCP